MTGYGRGENTRDGRKFTVEIKSVNHRYNDITIKLPRSMNYMEDTIRKKLTTQIARGKTDVYVFFETTSSEDVKIDLNEALTDAYVKQLEQIKARYNLKEEISLSLISRFPDILTVEKMDIDNDQMLAILMPAIDMALNELLALRQKEGLALKDDILLKLDKISSFVESIKLRSPVVVLDYREKLKARLKELLDNSEIDEARLLTEVTIFADRASVDEEITRLFSHINQVRQILNEKEAIGRKLDFLIQEMNREANTIGSKSNDIEITQTTVNLKSEIEKIREQVQNIE